MVARRHVDHAGTHGARFSKLNSHLSESPYLSMNLAHNSIDHAATNDAHDMQFGKLKEHLSESMYL